MMRETMGTSHMYMSSECVCIYIAYSVKIEHNTLCHLLVPIQNTPNIPECYSLDKTLTCDTNKL